MGFSLGGFRASAERGTSIVESGQSWRADCSNCYTNPPDRRTFCSSSWRIVWEAETVFESVVTRKAMHPAYQRIIGLGPPAVPMILKRLAEEPAQRFWALTAITGKDPAVGQTTLDGATALLEPGCPGGALAALSELDRAAVEAQIPRLADFTYRITSPRDRRYNCFAWAADNSERVWSPTILGSGVYWPPGIPALPSMSGVAAAYAEIGYEPCESEEFEPGCKKIAVFADASGEPRHAARQLPTGAWASKLGDHVVIEHDDLRAVGGAHRGFLRRASSDSL